ncbi:MAG: sugar ABC transporter substrate-binding protein [Christensenellales bacterium]
MKLLKTWIAVLVCLIMVAGMVGCANPAASNANTAPGENVKPGTEDKAPQDDTTGQEPAKEQIKIGVVLKSLSDSFWVRVSDGIKSASKENNVELILMAPDTPNDSAQQLRIMEDMITQQVDGIVLGPAGSKELVSAVKKANSANIPVVVIDTKLDEEEMANQGATIEAYIGSDNVEIGRQSGEALAQLLGGKGKVAEIEGLNGHESSIARCQGFEEAMAKYKDIEIVAKQPADWDTNKGFTVIQNIVQANPDLAGVWVASDLMGVGGAQAIKQAGKAGEIILVGVDGMPEAVQDIGEGLYAATLAQQPEEMGSSGIEAIIKIKNGETIEPVIYTSLLLIDESNYEKYLK